MADTRFFTLLLICASTGWSQGTKCAQCQLSRNSNADLNMDISGTVMFMQQNDDAETVITVMAGGFNQTDEMTLHGFHVHSDPDSDNNCNNMGGHFNPHGANHAAPYNVSRHVGDLGNIMIEADGTIQFEMRDSVVSLYNNSDNKIIGRSIVIHEGEDDLGLGGDDGSITTGNAGVRWACCSIEEYECSGVERITSNVLSMVPLILILFLLTFFR